MVIFTQREYEQWTQIVQKYNALRMEATEERDRKLDALALEYGVIAGDLVDEVPERYKEFKRKNDAIINAWESKLISLGDDYDNESDPIVSKATWRTAKSKTPEELCEDAIATILHHAYEEIESTENGETSGFSLFGSLYDAYELMLLDHTFLLNNGGAEAIPYADKVHELLERYKAGAITKVEAEPYKDYEIIRVEIAIPKTADVEKGKLPTIAQIYKAKQAIVTTDQLSKDFFKAQFLPDQMRPLTLKGGKKGEIVAQTYVTINYDGLENLKIFNANNSIEGFDRDVFNALCSLIEVGNEYLTEDMIYRAMRGYKVTGQISDAQRADIINSIRKLSVLRVAINTTAANDLYPDLAELSAESAMLDIDIVTCKYRDTTVENMIRVKEAPLMLRYAKALNQLDRRPIEYLSCPISGTKENIELQGFLYRRIILASSQKHLPNLRTIPVDRILEAIGVSKDTHKQFRVKKSRVLATVVKILDYWKDTKFITDYTTETETVGKNPTVTKFIISL